MTMQKSSTVYVAGGETLIGQALIRRLQAAGYENLLGLPGAAPDLMNATDVERFFSCEKPHYVFLASGKSGGIQANQDYPADLMLDNLISSTNVISSAHQHGVAKLLYLASSCSYPKLASQPLQVDSLLTGALEPTNEAYAVAKLAGLKLCEAYRKQHSANFITCIPANAFGLGDDFSLENSHVVPALLRKMHEARCAKQSFVEIWGTGAARREFIYADDLADACIFAMLHYSGTAPINLGGGEDVSIMELAQLVRAVVGFDGELRFDASKPDGMPLKALDSSILTGMGFQVKTSLREALMKTYQWFLENESRKGPIYA